MTFEIFHDPTRRILWVRFGKRLTQEGLARMQASVQAFVTRAGGCDAILDFSAVIEVDVPSHYLAALAQQKPVLSGHRRVIVAPKEVVFGLSRMFGSQQQAATGETPAVVRTLAEAFEALGGHEADFNPVES